MDEAVAYWRKTMKSGAGGDVKTRVTVLDRLRDPVEPHTVEQINRATLGCSKTPHNMGQNETRTLWNQLELICRTGANVNRFAENVGPPPRATRPCAATGCDRPLGISHVMGMHPACYEALDSTPSKPAPPPGTPAHPPASPAPRLPERT